MNTRKLLAVFAVFAVVASATAGTVAAAELGANPNAEDYQKTYIAEDHLTIASHDLQEMNWLEYEGDNGQIRSIDAHVNGTESGAKVAYQATSLEDDALAQFPRVGDENNSETWLNTGDWTTSGITLSDSDGATASGVPSVTISGSSGSATYDLGSDAVTTDVEKRYLQAVLDVNTLQSGATINVEVHDDSGDYVAGTITPSADGTAADVIANQTATGVVFQEQLGQLSVEGSGDGSLDAIQSITVSVSGGTGDVTITGLNAQKKSQWDFGAERVPDTSTDDADDYRTETVRDRPAGGWIEMSSLNDLGEEFSDSTVHQLRYLEVQYRMQDRPSDASISFPEATNYGGYPYLFDMEYRTTIPSAYDLTHGDMTLETKQAFLPERYTKIRYAEGVGDTATSEVSSNTWIDLSGSLGEEGQTITADSTVQADTTYVLEVESKILQGQYDALQQTAGGGGFWGGSGGSSNPFTSLYNWIVGGIVGLLGMIGLGRARS